MDKMISNVQEVVTRGANVLGVCFKGDMEESKRKMFEGLIEIPETLSLLSPVLSVVPLQLFSYYVAKAKGFDVDKPCNLAKSVTVE